MRWPLRVWLLLIGLLQAVWLPSAGAAEGEPALLTISRAQAVLEPDGAPTVRGEIDLAQRWDQRFPGQGGRASYRISLPPAPTRNRCRFCSRAWATRCRCRSTARCCGAWACWAIRATTRPRAR